MKINNNTISDMLHALADGQLDPRKREEILALLENDAELRGEMCDIYRTKDLVKSAYPLEDFEQNNHLRITSNYGSYARVASYLFAFILTFGAGYLVRDSGIFSHSVGTHLADTKVQKNKVILFLSSSEPEKFVKALSEAEKLAKRFQKTGGSVYVVTSSDGIDLLRLKSSPYTHQIKVLTNLYSSLNFVACNNSLYQFKKAGKPIELIDSAHVAPSAVEFVVKHLQQGWKYIAI